MQAWLDGDALVPEHPGLRGALQAARLHAEARGRIVIEVLADGAPVANALLDEPPADDAGVATLHMVSADRRSFVSVTLSDARESLNDIRSGQQEAAGHVQAGRMDLASEPLRRVVTGWSIVRDVVDHAGALLGVDPAAVVIEAPGDSPVLGGVCIQALAAQLTEVRRALSEQDWPSLSDALAYDMPGHADRWAALLDALRLRAETP